MDLAVYSEEVYNNIRTDLQRLSEKLHIEDANYIPISAKMGDNVVDASTTMPWYNGKTFLQFIETVTINRLKKSPEARLPVQTVIRPLSDEHHDYRGYAGRIAGGTFHTGDEVVILPSMKKSKIKSISIMETHAESATAGDSVSITLDDQIDISRGDLIVKSGELPQSGQNITLMTCWFNEKPLMPGQRYIIRNNTSETNCIVTSVNYRMNINTLEKETGDPVVNMNDVASVTIRTSKPLYYDSYTKNNITGSLVFISEGTNETAGAGMIE